MAEDEEVVDEGSWHGMANSHVGVGHVNGGPFWESGIKVRGLPAAHDDHHSRSMHPAIPQRRGVRSPHVVCVLLAGAQALTFKATEGQPWQGYGKQLPAQQRQALDALHPSNLRQLHAYRAEPADFGQCAPSLYCVRWSYCIARAARSGADPPTAAPAGTAAAVSQAAAPAVRCATARPACRCRSRFRTGRCVAPAARSGPKHRAAERWCNRADAYFRSGGE